MATPFLLYDVLVTDPIPAPAAEPTIWLSGAILTLLSKLIMPALWLAAIVGIPAWVYATTGRLSVAPGFRFIAGFALAATVLLTWFTIHLQSVGYRGRELMVANYWRKAAIPFDQVEAVEPVWWYKGRVVRIRFNRETPFGTIVYYMPKWGPLRAMFDAPEEELQQAIRDRNN